jgi:hypothetical protein
VQRAIVVPVLTLFFVDNCFVDMLSVCLAQDGTKIFSLGGIFVLVTQY